LAAVGIKVPGKCVLAGDLDTLLQWNGKPLGQNLKRRLVREFEWLELLT
jgi:hypothetical protein